MSEEKKETWTLEQLERAKDVLGKNSDPLNNELAMTKIRQWDFEQNQAQELLKKEVPRDNPALSKLIEPLRNEETNAKLRPAWPATMAEYREQGGRYDSFVDALFKKQQKIPFFGVPETIFADMPDEVKTQLTEWVVRTNRRVQEFNHRLHMLDRLHAAVGFAAEAAETLDLVKKAFFNNIPLDTDKYKKELGDARFYQQALYNQDWLVDQDVESNNYDKLTARYHKGFYSDEQAKERRDATQDTEVNGK